MTYEEFDKLVESRMQQIYELMAEKRDEYARRGDRLHNFKRAAGLAQKTPEETLAGMWLKHITSIFDMIDDMGKGNECAVETWDGKLNDNIIYTFLLEGLLVERARINKFKGLGDSIRATFDNSKSPKLEVREYEPKEF